MSASVQIMAWPCIGNKPLSGLVIHKPWWVKVLVRENICLSCPQAKSDDLILHMLFAMNNDQNYKHEINDLTKNHFVGSDTSAKSWNHENRLDFVKRHRYLLKPIFSIPSGLNYNTILHTARNFKSCLYIAKCLKVLQVLVLEHG